MKKYFLALYCITSLQVNAQSDTTWYDADWETVSTKDSATYYRPKPIRQTNGLYLVKDYFMSGALQMEAYSKTIPKDVYHGILKRYYENGQVEDSENYINNNKHGKNVGYYQNGKLADDEYYVNGLLQGVQKYYREDNGGLYLQVDYAKGLFHGDYIEYHKSGAVKRKEKWKRGNMKSGMCYDESAKKVPYYFHECCPLYPGGEKAYNKYIHKNIKYPVSCVKEGVVGYVKVIAVIDTAGSVMNVRVAESLHPDCDAEAKRLILGLPKQIPALNYDGKRVNRTVSLIVYFDKMPTGAVFIDPISAIIKTTMMQY